MRIQSRLYPLIYGQIIVILIVISTMCQDYMINECSLITFMFIELIIYILIFLVTMFVIKQNHIRIEKCMYFFILSGCIDFLYSLTASYSFQKLDTCILIYIEQLVYPMVLLFENMYYQKKIKKKRLIVYLIFISIYLSYNILKTKEQIKISFCGILYIFVANILEMSNSYMQLYATKKMNVYAYIMYTSLWSIVFRSLYIIGSANKNINYEVYNGLIKGLYLSALYIIVYVLYYVLTIIYIEKYSCPSFYAHTITSNLYLAGTIIIKSRLIWEVLGCFGCLAIALVFVWIEIPKTN